MANGRDFDRPGTYHIQVKGNLDSRWSDWFGGMGITAMDNDETLLAGQVTDQARPRRSPINAASAREDGP